MIQRRNKALSEQCSSRTKPWIHYGLTSSDVVDTSKLDADKGHVHRY